VGAWLGGGGSQNLQKPTLAEFPTTFRATPAP
jgi:hypothetical protein